MEKKLIMLGVIDEEGFDITNRLYGRGGCSPTLTLHDVKIARKYERNKSIRSDRQEPKEK